MEKSEIIRRSQLVPGTGGRPDYAEHLYEAAMRLPNNSRILEIGAYQGGSGSVFALANKDRGGLVYSIDPGFWSRQEQLQKYDPAMAVMGDLRGYLKNLILTEAEGYCIPLPGTSEEVFKRWKGEIFFDMVFIDGWHTYEGAKIDLQWLKYIKPNGFCVFDDWLEGIEKAWKEYRDLHPEWEIILSNPHTFQKSR